MISCMLERTSVLRGGYKAPNELFGPLPAVRDGNVLAYEFALPPQFVPWPNRTNVERTFVLLDLGISFAQPCWQYLVNPDGSRTPGVDADSNADRSWYVDLVEVTHAREAVTVRDLFADVIVSCDGRGLRLLDLDEMADALEHNVLTTHQLVDGLRRWQSFFDRHLHVARDPRRGWRDFPPASIRQLAAMPGPLGPVVVWEPGQKSSG